MCRLPQNDTLTRIGTIQAILWPATALRSQLNPHTIQNQPLIGPQRVSLGPRKSAVANLGLTVTRHYPNKDRIRALNAFSRLATQKALYRAGFLAFLALFRPISGILWADFGHI